MEIKKQQQTFKCNLTKRALNPSVVQAVGTEGYILFQR